MLPRGIAGDLDTEKVQECHLIPWYVGERLRLLESLSELGKDRECRCRFVGKLVFRRRTPESVGRERRREDGTV